MEFQKIKEETKVYPGEYLLHKPTNNVVVCGAFKRQEGIIRCMAGLRLFEDKIENFRKIKLNQKEQKERTVSRCKGCGK
jgi:hypothetical protein